MIGNGLDGYNTINNGYYVQSINFILLITLICLQTISELDRRRQYFQWKFVLFGEKSILSYTRQDPWDQKLIATNKVLLSTSWNKYVSSGHNLINDYFFISYRTSESMTWNMSGETNSYCTRPSARQKAECNIRVGRTWQISCHVNREYDNVYRPRSRGDDTFFCHMIGGERYIRRRSSMAGFRLASLLHGPVRI